MDQVDWKEHNRLYDDVIEDIKRDIATGGLIKMSLERKQRLVSEIISRVQVVCGYDYDNDNDRNDNENGNDNHIDPLQQLIAIRRMSLIFTDNFEELQMEEIVKCGTMCLLS
jgi:hypothetical protein